jgi:hypothetical protein
MHLDVFNTGWAVERCLLPLQSFGIMVAREGSSCYGCLSNEEKNLSHWTGLMVSGFAGDPANIYHRVGDQKPLPCDFSLYPWANQPCLLVFPSEKWILAFYLYFFLLFIFKASYPMTPNLGQIKGRQAGFGWVCYEFHSLSIKWADDPALGDPTRLLEE